MKKQTSRNTFILTLALCLSAATFAQAQATSPAETVKQLERDWSNAQKAGDAAKLGQILADDWMGLGSDGVISNKKQSLENVSSGANKLMSFEFGPMEVKMIGTTVAIVQGSDTEKSSFKGKDTSGKWLWMDVFELRNGKWVAVRSQSAMAK